MAALAELLGQLDPDPGRRGKQFERICKWYLENYPVYSHELKHVWLWKEWPDRWKETEAGIDLVAEHQDGTLWAIQAKAYAEGNSVTKHDMDSFLSESSRPQFSYRLLIMTTNLLASHAQDVAGGSAIHVGVVDHAALEAAQLNWPASLSDLFAPQLPPKSPLDHQLEAINAVVERFDGADRGQLISACGTGKTLTAMFIRETLAAQRTLVLVPSLLLLKQTLSEWRANTTTGFKSLPVCSDVKLNESDAAMSSTSDLGFPVTTDPEKIAAFLRDDSAPRVVFSTYQSSPEIAKAFKLGDVPDFDLVIADEAHRCAGPVSSDFATVLDGEKIKARHRLFMTATPRIFSARVIQTTKEADFEYASMNDEDKFGEVFHRLSFAEAIKRDLLTDYQVAIIGVDNALYRDWADKAWFVTTDGIEVTDARSLAGQIGVAKATRDYHLHRVITFHSRVKKAQEFADSFPEVIAWMPANERPTGQVWSKHVSGEMPTARRRGRLHHLAVLDEAPRALLANARCLSEGIDVPTLDGVAFIDPKRSEVDIVQAVGRAIRRAPDKSVGTIVIPVFVDTDADAQVALDDSAFKPVWDVILAVRAHDEELGKQIDELRRQLGRLGKARGPLRLPPKIHVDLPDRVGEDFARAFDVRLVEQTTASWEFSFGVLEHFVERHGHARVPQSYTVDGYALGSWVSRQRYFHRKGALDVTRERRLKDLPGWTWDTLADRWEEGFSRLCDYFQRYGHARVPQSYILDDYPLGKWVVKQRQKQIKGTLEADRRHRLEDLAGWKWDPFAESWEEGFGKLLHYINQNGDASVAQSYTVDGYRLGAWVARQRSKYAKGTLEADAQRRLQELPGWKWNTVADRWEEGFTCLQHYVEKNRHARVPASYTVDGYRLGRWVNAQRNFHREGTLNAEREGRLQDVPGWTWDILADQWEDGFGRLVDYVKRHGHAHVPQSYIVDGYKLGHWVGRQRQMHSKGTLDPDRQRRLQDLPGWTWMASSST